MRSSQARKRLSIWTASVLGGCLGLAGCNDRSSPFVTSYAVVAGTVTDAADAPVGHVTVQGHTYYAECGPSDAYESFSQAVTDAAGDYTVLVGTLSPPREACLALRVLPPAGSGLRDTTLTNLHVQMRKLDATPLDTLYVSVKLRGT